MHALMDEHKLTQELKLDLLTTNDVLKTQPSVLH